MSIREKLLEASIIHNDKEALFVDDISHSYKAFFYDSFRCANAIIENGFAGNMPIVIMGMRSYHTYTGIIGALVAGGYYVPTNPLFPAERNLKILLKSKGQYVFFDSRYENEYGGVLKNCNGLKICTDNDCNIGEMQKTYPQHIFFKATGYSCDVPNVDPQLDSDLVYLLFTSGSTGEPKGVAITSANIENYLYATSLRQTIYPCKRFIQLFDLTFDPSAHNIFLALTNGASLYIADDKSILNPISFAKKHKITHWGSVPTIVAILEKLRLLKDGILPDMEYTMLCGEALPYDLTRKWSLAAPNSVIENLYGPTEATITCTYYKYDPSSAEKMSINGFLPIGLSFAGMKTIAVDENLKLVKKGEIGELLLAGKQLAAGYLDDKEKTAEKFINIHGDIFYRTGDLVCENEAGFVFVGRADTQIKIRGYRIELSEVEYEGAKYARTSLVVAIPIQHGSGEYSGIALFVQDGEHLDKADLISRLQKTLPPYMVPSVVIPISEFPRNASGKIDRNKLKELI